MYSMILLIGEERNIIKKHLISHNLKIVGHFIDMSSLYESYNKNFINNDYRDANYERNHKNI